MKHSLRVSLFIAASAGIFGLFQNCAPLRSTDLADSELTVESPESLTLKESADFVQKCGMTDDLGTHRSVVLAQMFDGRATNVGLASVRLSQYSFRIMADGSCSIREDYWAWTQASTSLPVSAGTLSLPTGEQCQVSTAVGFTEAPKTRFGTYYVGDGLVAIEWSATEKERWRFDRKDRITKFALDVSTHMNRGSGWASKISFGRGVDLSQVSKKSYKGLFSQNNFSAQSTINQGDALSIGSFKSCEGGNCFTLRQWVNSAPATFNDNFIARGPGRQDFYNHQKDIVDGAVHPCIGVNGAGKGHLKPMLQILDDGGVFRGWVGIEASLWSRKYGESIVGIFDLNDVL